MGLWDRDYMRRRPSPAVEASECVLGTVTPRPRPVRRGVGGACLVALLLQIAALAAPWLTLGEAGKLEVSWTRTRTMIEASGRWIPVSALVLGLGWALMTFHPSRLCYAFASILGTVPVLGVALGGVPGGVWAAWLGEIGWGPAHHAAATYAVLGCVLILATVVKGSAGWSRRLGAMLGFALAAGYLVWPFVLTEPLAWLDNLRREFHALKVAGGDWRLLGGLVQISGSVVHVLSLVVGMGCFFASWWTNKAAKPIPVAVWVAAAAWVLSGAVAEALRAEGVVAGLVAFTTPCHVAALVLPSFVLLPGGWRGIVTASASGASL